MHKNLIALSAALCMSFAGTAFAQAAAGTAGAAASGSAGTSAAPGAATGPVVSPSAKSAASPAADGTDARAMKKQADAEYKSAKALCKPMKGDEKKSCERDAKAAHKAKKPSAS